MKAGHWMFLYFVAMLIMSIIIAWHTPIGM